ncbi:peptidylprolyl isomerase [Lentisphaerota bacterium WC36G]|nr:peptidylprolyl isomerase [Lentisphaerae bacterium WC36]
MAKKITKAMALTFATVVGLSLNAAEVKKDEKVTAEKAPVAKEAKKDIFADVPNVVAKLGDREITKDELIGEIKETIAQNANFKGRSEEEINTVIKQNMFGFLTGMINNDILLGLAAKEGIVPSEVEAKKLLGEAWNKASKQQKEMFQAQLKKRGMTFKDHVEKLAKTKQFQEEAAIERWVLKFVMPKDEELEKLAKKQYDENKEKAFKIPATKEGEVVASHILIRPELGNDEVAKSKAAQLIKDIKYGKITFEEAARKNSACPSGARGGSLGSFGKGMMAAEFEKAAFELAEEAIHPEPVKTQFGYHVIRRDKAQKEDSYVSFDEVKDKIISRVKQGEIQKRVTDILNKEKEAQKLQVFIKEPAPMNMLPPEMLEQLKKQAAEQQKKQKQSKEQQPK